MSAKLKASKLLLIGNHPSSVVSVALRHKASLKALTTAASIVGTLAVVYQNAFNHAWYDAAEDGGVFTQGANATVVTFIRPSWFGGDKGAFVQEPVWWWAVLDYALSGANLFVFAVLPWIVFNGWAYLRHSTIAVLLAAALLANLVVGGFRQLVAGAGIDQGAKATWGLFTLGLVWLVQLAPATAAPALLKGALRGLVHNMWRLQVAYMLGLSAFSFVMLSVMAPLFAESSPLMQVVIRVVLYTAILELTIAVVRVCSRANFSSHLPRDNLVVLLAPIIISAGLLGRILSSNMDTIGETIGVAVAISFTEVFLRLTLPSRDRVLLRCCWRACPCVFPTAHDRRWERPAAPQDFETQRTYSDGSEHSSTYSLPVNGVSVPPSARTRSPAHAPGPLQVQTENAPSAIATADTTPPAPSEDTAGLPASSPATSQSVPPLDLPGHSDSDDESARWFDLGSLTAGQMHALRARAAREAQDIHAYFSLLTLDTMSEDIGILLSLPFALIMRLPPRVGGQPLGALDVLARVGGQYALELLTDMAPALLMVCVNVCCGVRWRRVGGGAVRGAVLRQLAAEAAGEDKAVEGAMSTPYVMQTPAPVAEDGSHHARVLHTSERGASSILDDSAPLMATGHDKPPPHGSKTPLHVAKPAHSHSASVNIGDPSLHSSTNNSLSSSLQPPSGMHATGSAQSSLGPATSPAPLQPAGSSSPVDMDSASPGDVMQSNRSKAAIPADPSRRSARAWCCACDCVLHADDGDVQAHRAQLDKRFAREIRRVTDDATWQPLEWRGMLRLAVESSSGDGEEAPARVLWRDVRRVEDMSTTQLLVAWLSIRAEVVAVRLGRAWETRFRRWNVLFLIGVVTAALINARNYAGPLLRCRLQDADGVDYFDFCDEEV